MAWLSLDAGDNDPVRFWRYVAAALDRAGVAVAGRLAPLLRDPDPPSPEAVVTALVNELTARPEPDPVVLLLDDYHRIEASRSSRSPCSCSTATTLAGGGRRPTAPPCPPAPAEPPSSARHRASPPAATCSPRRPPPPAQDT